MSKTPDPDIAAIFERLNRAFDHAPTGATAVMEHRLQSLDPLFSIPKDVFSAHQRIRLQPDLDALARIMDEIPLVAEARTGWKIVLSTRGLSRRPTQGPLTFVIRLGGFDITKPASNRWRRAAEMLSRTRARMGTVARATEAEAGAVQRWLVQARGRDDKVLNARSAREAAWIYAALYLRTRKEIEAWESVTDSIRQVSAIAPAEAWRELYPET